MTMPALTFSAVLLAAGTSTRMQGWHKLLLPVGSEPVVRRTARAVLEAGPQELVVVTGFNARAVVEALVGLPVGIHFNQRYEEGQMTSVAAGVAALREPCNIVMVCLADQVLLRPSDYRELLTAFAAMPHGSILVPEYEGQRGNPVLFSASYASEVSSGRINPGCRKLIDEHPEEVSRYSSGHDRFVRDMDTPEDYVRIVARIDAERRAAIRGATV